MGCFSFLSKKFKATDAHFEEPAQPQLYSKSGDFDRVPAYSQLDLKPSDLELNPAQLHLESTIDKLSSEMRSLSLSMHGHPELSWKEFDTAKLLSNFMESKGFKVIRGIGGIETAWSATFVHGTGTMRTVGFNSEMDALPGLGHACGHNLIAISGIVSALAVAATLVKFNIPGRVILLGTPAEEKDGGKINLIKAGAYSQMHASVMLHPAPNAGLGEMLAVSEIRVEYTGHSAHATTPWEGINALDAAVAAYTNISVLRQQIKPTHRIHGIMIPPPEGWVTNIIPEKSTLTFGVRAPTMAEVDILKLKIEKCFDAAALATGCSIKKTWFMQYKDLRNSSLLGKEYQNYMEGRQGTKQEAIEPLGSTDFGDVSYELPALHPMYAIPVGPGEGNHTAGFAKAAATIEAHNSTLSSAKGISITAWKVLIDQNFVDALWDEFRAMKK